MRQQGNSELTDLLNSFHAADDRPHNIKLLQSRVINQIIKITHKDHNHKDY